MKKRKVIREMMICICIGVLIFSTATYAWYLRNNKVDADNLSITVGGTGILEIAADTGNGPGQYGSELSFNVTGSGMDTMVLNPVTTKNGTTFYSPVYTGNSVTSVKEILDRDKLCKKYIFEKTFYLRAKQNPSRNGQTIVSAENRVYDIFLVGPSIDSEHAGTSVYQSPDIPGAGAASDSATRAIRVSFELGDGTVIIFEPNADASNQDTNRAADHVNTEYGNYTTIKQSQDGIFIDSDNGQDSPILFQITEGRDVKVTMRVWIEGTDVDCADSITMDTIMAMFEFMSKEAGAD